MTTVRFTAEERRIFTGGIPAPGRPRWQEPALGTLDERLGIILRRLGGRTAAPRPTEEERAEYAEWLKQSYLDDAPTLGETAN